MSEERLRILIAEDDQDLLELTSAILGQEAEVDCASDPAAALRHIANNNYDLLVTDLNIECGGDGLLLAGAMRYLHPHARTVLITGYPDFTRALSAMQSSLDLVLIKPVDVVEIRKLARPEAAPPPARSLPVGKETVWSVIDRQQTEILGAWLKTVESDPVLRAVALNAAERMDHMEKLLAALVCHGAGPAEQEERASAGQHGHMRNLQNYRPEWIAMEIGYLRRAIFDVILRELLELDLSRLTVELFAMNSRLDMDLLESLRVFGLRDH